MLERQVTRLALCWRLVRADGVQLGLTSADRPLVVDGLRYASAPGMTPSAVSAGDGLEADALAVEGAVAALGGDALEAGRWTGARVELFACDRAEPRERVVLATGTLGSVTIGLGRGPLRGESFRAELLGPQAALDAVVVPRCSPHCRATLGDAACGVDMAGRTQDVAVAGVAGSVVTLAAPLADAERYAHGRLRLLTGPAAGLDAEIAAADGGALTLDAPLRAAVPAETRARMWEGCDRRLSTCASRFGNAANFQGEPHVPGTDALLAYG